MSVRSYWPAEWVQPNKRTFDHIVLGVTGFLIVVALWDLTDGVVHTFRWRQARRWERMLGDPTTAEFVPPLATHLASAPSPPPIVVILGRFVLFGAASVGLIAYGTLALTGRAPALHDEKGHDQSVYFLFAGILFVLLTLGAARDMRRWRVTRTVERLSSDAAIAPSSSVAADVAVQHASAIPPLNVVFNEDPAGPLAQAIAGRPAGLSGDPLRVMYFRLFDNIAGTAYFLKGPLRFYGHIFFLEGAAQVDPDDLELAEESGSVGTMLISTPEQLDGAITRQATGRFDPPRPDGFLKTWRWATNKERGRYPVVALLCHDSFWKAAVDILLARMDFVALDLSGYRPQHAGTRYELQRVIDRCPLDRVTFLAEMASDRLFLTGQVEAAWAHMADGSPNAGTGLRTAHVVVVSGR